MNKLMIIGNLTRDPEVRSVQGGYTVCDFTVAVNNTRRNQNQAEGQNDATFFRVTTWNKLAENCSQFLKKGRKVCVVGQSVPELIRRMMVRHEYLWKSMRMKSSS